MPEARSKVLVALGARIRGWRKERGWSQEELAHRCKIDRSFMSGIERGKRNISVLSVGTLDARLRFYPVRTSGFFIAGGLGLGTLDVGFGSETGVGAIIGLGWDTRVRSNLSLTPFWNGFAMRSSNADANVGQLGLSVTVH